MKSYVLNNLVEEVVIIAKKYSDRTITIESEISPLEIKADYSRFKQVLLNLIDNAIKYSDVDTPIIFKLDRLQ